MSDQLLAEAHRFLDWARAQGADLDGTDGSVWFVDPQADNIGFKFAGALGDFGEPERAREMYAQLQKYHELDEL
ncbi:hypothetical protein GCM10027290_49250 [Micromonospora sonneratiae]|uniref:Uncharacterized protein n=1 Tax=Micromonospora sonneratiae TaxID=1184706 RepID=A0ABW3YGP3_9ACTN